MSKQDITDIMINCMDKQGILTKVRAQIKASVYKMIDGKNEKGSNFFWENIKGQELHKNKSYLLILELIKEFLQFFDFDYTLSVLSRYYINNKINICEILSECNLTEKIVRNDLCNKIGINRSDISNDKPILMYVFQQYTSGGKIQSKLNEDMNKINHNIIQKEEKSKPVKPVNLKQTEFTKEIEKKNSQQTQPTQKIDKYNSKIVNTQKQQLPNNKKLGGFEEIEEDDMFIESNEQQFELNNKAKKQKENPMFTSSEDFMASQSQGYDFTVDSTELEKYDHIEEIQFRK